MPSVPLVVLLDPDFTEAQASWKDRAACKYLDPDEFDTEPLAQRPRRKHGSHWAYARMICRECPVVRDCLNFAIDNDEPTGIWGGMTRSERTVEKKARGTSA